MLLEFMHWLKGLSGEIGEAGTSLEDVSHVIHTCGLCMVTLYKYSQLFSQQRITYLGFTATFTVVIRTSFLDQ